MHKRCSQALQRAKKDTSVASKGEAAKTAKVHPMAAAMAKGS